MDFSDLKTELSNRGFAHLSDTRLGTYVNAARAELDRTALWPWREKSATGAAPLTITDLGTIEAVLNTTQSSFPLQRVDYRTLVENYGDLSTSGTALYYYVAWPSGTPEVATYPSGSDTIGVQYWRITPDLSADSDTPASPAQAHYTIVDLAVRRASRDSGNDDVAAAIQPEIDNAISQLIEQYPPGMADGPEAYVGVSFASSDW